MTLSRTLRARLVRCALCIVAMILAVLAHGCTATRITGVELVESGSSRLITLPFSEPKTKPGPLVFHFHLRAWPLSHRSIVVVPDDRFVSLAINGTDVPLAGIPHEELEDFRNGFALPIGPYLHAGDNTVTAQVFNRGGPGGLDVRADPLDWPTALEALVGIGALFALFAELVRGRGLGWPAVAVLLTAIVVRAAYLSVTPYNVRQHDADSHVEYVEYLLAHHALPSAKDGYAFYHPPLYYVLSALQWAALSLVGLTRPSILFSLQIQSTICELGFAVISIATVKLWLARLPPSAFGRRLTSKTGVDTLVAALILLWPSSVVHAARVGNDDLAYLFFAAALYFTSRWWLSGANRDVYLAAFLGALGVVTKTNDLLVFGVLFLVFPLRLLFIERERRVWAYVRRGWPAVALFVVAVTAALGTALRDALAGDRSNVLIANADRTRNAAELTVGNHAKNYLWFDAWGFVTHPFTSAWDDAMGRQWFSNYVLKTSLIGEFSYSRPWASGITVVLSVLLLAMIAALVPGVLLRRRRDWLDELPLLLTVALSVVSLALVRMSIPRACSCDFRYILPVIGPCVLAYARSVTLSQERGWRVTAVATAALGWTFVATSVAFFLALAVARG